MVGNYGSFLSARIAYFLNLTGPNIVIDTACSSSLVAIHQACQSIILGESEMAIAGGVSLLATPNFHIACSKSEMLAADGKCRAFDDGASGMVTGEAVGVVVLKSMSAAISDGDHIYGVIKGSAVNYDGRTNGITAPSAISQTRLETEVYDKFHIDPENISYVEAHGTGTKLGDPIEVMALTDAFRKYTDKRQYCAIGSVKSNIGHTLTAAGVASLIKVLLCMKNNQLVPSINYSVCNQHINLKESPFFVNTQLRSWTSEYEKPRIAAISSFGLSGTNCHMIVQEAPVQLSERIRKERPCYLIPISARNEGTLMRKIQDLYDWLEGKPDVWIGDIAYTLQTGRCHLIYRGALLTKDVSELRKQLAEILQTGKTEGYLFGKAKGNMDEEDLDRCEGIIQALNSAEGKQYYTCLRQIQENI